MKIINDTKNIKPKPVETKLKYKDLSGVKMPKSKHM